MYGVVIMLCVFVASPISAILIVGGVSMLCKAKEPASRRQGRYILSLGVAGIVGALQSSYFASVSPSYQNIVVILLTVIMVAGCINFIIAANFFQKDPVTTAASTDEASAPTS